EETAPVQTSGRYGRRGTKWFSFELPVAQSHPMTLVVTYGSDARRNGSLDVLVDGTKVGTHSTERRSPELDVRFFAVEYALPPELVRGKSKVTVRFETGPGNERMGVVRIRL